MMSRREEERKRLAIERQIDAIVGRMAISKEDRARATGMLHYMNLGPGRGQRWSAERYAQHSGDEPADVKRCYRLLRNHPSITTDGARGLFTPGAAGKAALERRSRKSEHTDMHALLGLLVFERAQMSPMLFDGLWQLLNKQLPREKPPHNWLRWFTVREGLRETGELEAAFKRASQVLADTPARGGPKTMERSYYFIEHRKLGDRNVRPYTKRPKA